MYEEKIKLKEAQILKRKERIKKIFSSYQVTSDQKEDR